MIAALLALALSASCAERPAYSLQECANYWRHQCRGSKEQCRRRTAEECQRERRAQALRFKRCQKKGDR